MSILERAAECEEETPAISSAAVLSSSVEKEGEMAGEKEENSPLDSSVLELKTKKKKKKPVKGPEELPENFNDEELVAVLRQLYPNPDDTEVQDPPFCNLKYPLSIGLLLKLRSGFLRIYRRSSCKFHRTGQIKQFGVALYEVLEQHSAGSADELTKEMVEPCQLLHAEQFYGLACEYTKEKDLEYLTTSFTPLHLWFYAEEVAVKSINLNVKLQKLLLLQPVIPFDQKTGQLLFASSFLTQVHEFHQKVQRPEGTFHFEPSKEVKVLLQLERQECPSCQHRRQTYCGPCNGLLLPHAKVAFPEGPVKLPFDVGLVLHWCESAGRCTGVHIGATCTPGTLEIIPWCKENDDWKNVIESLDPDRDVILFPYADAIPASEFQWNIDEDSIPGGEEGTPNRRRRRLLVLEASWGYGKTMSMQIVEHRQSLGLRPIPSVILTNVTGTYWRFQSEGHSAVSTIEAITHAAVAAGLEPHNVDVLLRLFDLQKARVLNNADKGNKTPRAMQVTGVGMGDWRQTLSI